MRRHGSLAGLRLAWHPPTRARNPSVAGLPALLKFVMERVKATVYLAELFIDPEELRARKRVRLPARVCGRQRVVIYRLIENAFWPDGAGWRPPAHRVDGKRRAEPRGD